MNKLSKLDSNIITLLQEDGRMSFLKIAERLGVTDGTVRRRYKALVEEGYLKVSALCDPYKIGFDAPVFVGIHLRQESLSETGRQIARMPEVQFLAITTGPYELMVKAVVKSNSNLYDFLMKLSKFEGVISTQTLLVLDILKNSWSLADIGSEKNSAD